MKAIILLSGGLDSTVCLATAIEQGRDCFALGFDYEQRHKRELEAAKQISLHYGVPFSIIKIDPLFLKASALVGNDRIAKGRSEAEIASNSVPTTYVPARNTLFIAYALGYAESVNAQEIYFGANAQDRNSYPDCRKEYFEAYQQLINLATNQAISNHPPKLILPLIDHNKKEIVKLGRSLKAPIDLSFSCYDPNPDGTPCQECDACCLRKAAFSA